MRKIHLLGLALVAVLSALSAIGASSAFAALEFETGLWLVAAADAGTQTVLAEGELLLEDEKLGIAVVCSGMFNGLFEGSEDLLITEVVSLGGVKYFGELTGEGLLCKEEKGCAENADLEVWPLNLPWLLFAELDKTAGEPFVLVFGDGKGAPGYEVKCLVLGISTEESCTALEGSGNEVTNAAGGVETLAGAKAEPNGNCTVGGEGAGVIVAFTSALLSSPSGVVSISTP